MIGNCRFSSRSNSCGLKWSRNHIVSCPSSLPLPFSTEHPHIHQQYTAGMSFESDPVQYPSTENTDALWPEPFFAPPPQHTEAPPPELFDQEVGELDLNFPFEQFDDFLPTFYDSIPVTSTPPALTYSTDSQYSSDFTQSDYSIPSESYYSSDNGLYGTDDSIHPAVFSNGPPSIPLHPADAQFDFVTSDLNSNVIGISPRDLSIAMKSPPTPLPVHVTPASEVQMAPASDRPFKCPHCPHCKAETI